jgi:hypothetical protein
VRKAAIGSLDGDLRTAGGLWIEPVRSSLAGACFPPLLVFRSASMLNTKVPTTTKLSRVRGRGVSQGTAKRFRIGPSPRKARFAFGNGNFYNAAA